MRASTRAIVRALTVEKSVPLPIPDTEGLLAAEKGFGHIQDGVAGGQRLATRPFRSERLTRLRLPFSGSHETSFRISSEKC